MYIHLHVLNCVVSCVQLCHVSCCRRILDDLSSADATLKAAGTDPLALAAAATLQAQQVETPLHNRSLGL